MSGSLRGAFGGFWLLLLLAWVASSLSAATCLVQKGKQSVAPASTQQDSLKRFLQNYLGPRSDEERTRYVAAFTDLNGDGVREAIVYVIGPGWCGSGGCITFVLNREGSSYTVVTKITITRAPIRVVDHVSNGWRDIGVWVVGGGIQHGYEAELPFDGKTYPSNPSMPPARKSNTKAPGQVLIPASANDIRNGKPLYP